MKKETDSSTSSNSIEQGWISIYNPPKKTGYYLVYDENTFGESKIELYRYDAYNSAWVLGAGQDPITDTKRTYWRPLPAPPNSEQEDKRSVATKDAHSDAAGNQTSLSKEEGKDEKDLEQSRIDYYEDKIDMLNRIYKEEIERLKRLLKIWFYKAHNYMETSQRRDEVWQQFQKENGLKGE